MNNFGHTQSAFSTAGNKQPVWPACVCADDAARLLGWPPYFMPLLARAGHLKPLGKPGQNARKWYAMVELERLSRDPVWLDKAIRIVDRLVREGNGQQKGKGQEVAMAE